MRLLLAILLAAAVPLASAQTIIEKAKSEQAKQNAAAAKANAAKAEAAKANAAKAEAAKAAAAKKKAQPQSGGEKMNEMMRNKGKPPAK